ncbi:hypothetical protein HOY80DRAFT_472812 [Tuber brumale]|nr:hypothetical protein HOY80DRAFT_472812 [Tuber brumale]
MWGWFRTSQLCLPALTSRARSTQKRWGKAGIIQGKAYPQICVRIIAENRTALDKRAGAWIVHKSWRVKRGRE